MGNPMSKIPPGDDHPYTKLCSQCGKAHTICTQRDNKPEYYTYVYLICSCGEAIEFRLPVN